MDLENQAPGYDGGMINRNLETVRRRVAAQVGCDSVELAVTRNASESLQIAQNGLDLKAGDVRWATRLRANPRIRILSSLEPGETWGLAMAGIDGIEAPKISAFLRDKWRIIVTAVVWGQPPAQRFDFQGVRVTPNIYMAPEEVDTFADAMEDLAKNAPAATRHL